MEDPLWEIKWHCLGISSKGNEDFWADIEVHCSAFKHVDVCDL